MESRNERSNLRVGHRRSRGSPVPLFERLTDTREPDHEPLRHYDIAATRDSIRQEVYRIVNTRTPFRRQPAPGKRFSAICYGVPDFSYLSASSATDRQAMIEVLEHTIESLEPRLTSIRVVLEENVRNKSALTGLLTANMRIGILSEAVRFPLELSLGGHESVVGSALEAE